MLNSYLDTLRETVGDRNVGPLLYLSTGAAACLYGAYEVADTLRGRPRSTAIDWVKASAPVLVGSGLVWLGVRNFQSAAPNQGNPIKEFLDQPAATKRPRATAARATAKAPRRAAKRRR